jgi:aldehyde dehydrogenase (NAD+)
VTQVGQEHQMFVAGEWVASESGAVLDATSPSTGEVIGTVPDGTRADAQRAIDAARAAWPGWAGLSAFDRAAALRRVAGALDARREDLAHTLALDQGKPKRAEAEDEVTELIDYFEMAAAEATRMEGLLPPSVDPRKRVLVQRVPRGVVAVISPWNWPYTMPGELIAPALAYGNAVVIKPADITPASVWALAEIMAEVGVPAGVFNLVMGRGSTVGEAMINHAGIDAISFTGSQGVGGRIAEACARTFKRYQLEMGGKNPLVVLDDADLDLAIEGALNGAFFSTGQRCTASSRLIVTKGIYGAFVDRLKARLEALVVGHALDPATQMGPVVSDAQLKQDVDYVDIGVKEGARLVFGGARLERPTRGFYMQPALFADVDNSMRIAREEIFGPVAGVIPADTPEHALQIANDTPFGLSAGVYTSSLKHARLFQDELKSGMVMVNLPTAGVDLQAPFGGTKASSFGPREQGPYARDFYTRWKTCYVTA